MQFSQFEEAWAVLISAYGDKLFPNIRKKLFFQRFEHADARQFLEATKKIAFSMMPAAQVGGYLEERFPAKQVKHQEAPQDHYACEPCKDWGFGWIDHNIIPCVCAKGQQMPAEEIARQQRNYEVGRRVFKSPATLITKSLPYDPRKRGA